MLSRIENKFELKLETLDTKNRNQGIILIRHRSLFRQLLFAIMLICFFWLEGNSGEGFWVSDVVDEWAMSKILCIINAEHEMNEYPFDVQDSQSHDSMV